MKPATVALLRCVAPQSAKPTKSHDRQTQAPRPCGGKLTLRSGQSKRQTLVCTRCAVVYRIESGIPTIVVPMQHGADENGNGNDQGEHYVDEEIIRTYYEAHYARYFKDTASLRNRVSFPYLAHPEHDDVAAPDAAYTSRRSPFDQAVAHLAKQQELTDDFYQQMLDWCRPYLHSKVIVLDAGCGLGRMTAEIARLGVKHVLGVDRSPRMIQEAQRILAAQKPLRLTLNTIGGAKGMPAVMDQRWDVRNYDLVVGDVECLPVRAGRVDLVTCLNVLDRVDDPQRLVDELWRVLKPEGHLVIADPYHWEVQYTPRARWVGDMTTLFSPDRWQCLREADGIPFVLRYYRRRITIYMNHCLLLQRRPKL
jgi:SAM-dependent methyltransferase/uncharacterized protein YbaR (Trm112 family)